MKSKSIINKTKVKEVGQKLANGEIIELPEIRLCEDRISQLNREVRESNG